MGNRFTIPQFSYDVISWNDGVLGVLLLFSTIGWCILLLVGLYLGMEDIALEQRCALLVITCFILSMPGL